MRKLILLLSFCVTVSFAQTPGDIVITEIMNNPSAVVDSDGEWFEVYNTTSSSIDMDSWVVSDNGPNSFIVMGQAVVPAGGYFVFGSVLVNLDEHARIWFFFLAQRFWVQIHAVFFCGWRGPGLWSNLWSHAPPKPA